MKTKLDRRGRSGDEGHAAGEIGGFISGAVLILFGIGALFLGINGYQTVGDELSKEQIVGGSDMAPAESRRPRARLVFRTPSPCRPVTSSMRRSTPETRPVALRSTCASMRWRRRAGSATHRWDRRPSAAKPEDPAGTSDETAAAKDENGQPVSNGARNLWINETALATALNVSYMAERISVFGIVVGIALILTGIGLVILAFAVFGRNRSEREVSTRIDPSSRNCPLGRRCQGACGDPQPPLGQDAARPRR